MNQMKKIKFYTNNKTILADTHTPVSIYLKIRDRYANSFLLESSDYHGEENSYSYLCFEPVAEFKVEGGSIYQSIEGGDTSIDPVRERSDVLAALNAFISSFEAETREEKYITNGLFGYISYNAVTWFEDLDLRERTNGFSIPDIMYRAFRFVLVFDHFKNQVHIFEHNQGAESSSEIENIIQIIEGRNIPVYPFSVTSDVESNYTDTEFLEIIEKGREHCLKGDVFQIVLSRRFSNGFKGDEFNVYRALRSVNPSPYLFYFDYGTFKIFGSSPEAQIVIKDRKATIYPIAGTFRRTGNDEADTELARKLDQDEKENSEHVMLVDLARNDLNKSSRDVKVETFKEVQYYSHVIHLVSKVSGELSADVKPLQMVADTFPAGTLSGAPKYRAMELIDQYENRSRGYYGGAIGFLGFNGDFNHAIMIRSFLSHDAKLYSQAGAGVVAKSVAENEVQEVNNKLAALRSALEMAEEFSK
jgi:anthranilate synthase component 1